MKRFLISSIFAAIVAAGTAMIPQDYPDEYLGLPGDNLNLYAVMNLFQESETLEGFERSLNDENSRINNLDLNNDNYTDYIKVLDYVEGNVHTIVLQAVLGRNENQDVAVFTVQRLRDGSVQIQLVGDEALYGRNYIIEPYYAETPNPGYTGRNNRQNVTVVRTTYVEVAAWPVIRYIYMPNYVVWHSSWYWGYYPVYWNPWRPFYWHYYYGYHYHWFPDYYGHFHRYDRHRWDGWDRYYYRDRRVYSKNVTININSGKYKNTYSRPDQRREGEALYAKVHPERAATMSTNNGRRSSSEVSSSRQNNGSAVSTGRRSSGSVNSNSSSRSSNQNVSTTRRTNSNVNVNRSSNSSGNQNTGTVRRSSTTTVNERTRTTTSAGQNNGNQTRSSSGDNNRAVNRSTTTVNNRASSGSEASRTTVSNRRSNETVMRSTPSSGTKSSGQSAGSSRSSSKQESSARRSSSGSQKQSSTKQSSKSSSGKSKESDSSSSRRK